jgi:hypothetical protein
MKVCTKCRRSLPATLEFFRAYRRIKAGIGSACRDCTRAEYRRYFRENREAVRAKIRERDRAFQVERSRRQMEKRRADPEGARETDRQRRIRDRERINARSREYNRRLRARPGHRLRVNVSTVICRSLRDGKCGRSWEALVGYTVKELMIRLEKCFLPGMSWQNYGKYVRQWSIDHIRPVSSFEFDKPSDPEFKKCWALSNLRPLWHTDNIRKGNKWAS